MPTYVIAEVGSCHDGSIGNALRMVETFAELGADAVKFQCHAGQSVNGMHPSPYVENEARQDYYERTGFTRDQWYDIRQRTGEVGVDFIVSPFSVFAVDMLTAYAQPDAWKIASGEVTNTALLEAVKATGKPMYLSWGMATAAEFWAACQLLGSQVACRMQCTSEYPCPPERVGLNVINDPDDVGRTHAGVVLDGFSDHTLGLAASLAAITLGATVVERHVTLSRRMYGSDAAHSLEPSEFAQFVREVRELDRMLSSPVDKDELARSPEIQRMREVFLCPSPANSPASETPER